MIIIHLQRFSTDCHHKPEDSCSLKRVPMDLLRTYRWLWVIIAIIFICGIISLIFIFINKCISRQGKHRISQLHGRSSILTVKSNNYQETSFRAVTPPLPPRTQFLTAAAQSYENLAEDYQQCTPDYEQDKGDYVQGVPDYEQSTHDYEQNTHDYEQSTHDDEQSTHDYEQSTHDYEQSMPDDKQSTHDYEQSTPDYEQDIAEQSDYVNMDDEEVCLPPPPPPCNDPAPGANDSDYDDIGGEDENQGDEDYDDVG
ncbi:uncharacterized protein LOC121952892 [Plectropomus leopardus]|uniref:uncharacterized protein LOC121952892 n=1 Tax=Plectropomus leopardus TaxID=160734 RepID=UPI001C4AF2F1|nr:uncharacterized protein LOC121952892 [Plectropomus leopardus]